MRELERRVLLSVLDRKWREHLYEMDYLREGIYLRAYSQRDPLVEYQREGFEMFAAMMDGIKEEAVGFLFNLEVSVGRRRGRGRRGGRGPRADAAVGARAPRSPRLAPAEAAGPGARRWSGPRGSSRPGSRRTCPTPRPTEQGEVEVKGSTVTNADDPYAKVGRNAQCPCGSGKKYKMCHGRAGGPTGLTARACRLGLRRSRGRCRATGPRRCSNRAATRAGPLAVPHVDAGLGDRRGDEAGVHAAHLRSHRLHPGHPGWWPPARATSSARRCRSW